MLLDLDVAGDWVVRVAGGDVSDVVLCGSGFGGDRLGSFPELVCLWVL